MDRDAIGARRGSPIQKIVLHWRWQMPVAKKEAEVLDRGQLHKHIQALDKGDDASRRQAIQALRHHEEKDWAITPVAVCHALVASLQQQLVGTGKPPLILKDVAIILGRMGPRSKSAVPQLIALLNEGIPDPVREAAATALGKFGAEARDAVEPLLGLTQGQNALAAHSIQALGRIGCADHRVRTTLVGLWLSPFQTQNAQMQLATALCRLRIEAQGSLRFLTQHLIDRKSVV